MEVAQFVYRITLCNCYKNFIYNLIQHLLILKCDNYADKNER